MIARSDRIAAVTALASFVVEIDLNDRFQAARLSASGRSELTHVDGHLVKGILAPMEVFHEPQGIQKV